VYGAPRVGRGAVRLRRLRPHARSKRPSLGAGRRKEARRRPLDRLSPRVGPACALTRKCYTAPMFTGLVRGVGRVRSLREATQARRIVVDARLDEGDRALGASVCVSGVCLTVVDSGTEFFAGDIGF